MRSTAFARPTGRMTPRAAEMHERGVIPTVADREHFDAIVASHERCVALGVSRIEAPDLGLVARSDLSLALERNRRLHEHAAPVMAVLHEQIERTESMVVLTDALGTVIHAIGDDDFLERASKVALSPGANWSESSKGTNAVGTALVDEKPTLVHADEHFLHANSFLTCSAAPILDPRGNMLGVLDVSGDFRSYHKHTLALVRISARMIENRWLSEDFGDALRVHFHARPEFIGTLMEGIIAVGGDGRILGANRSALEQLGMSGAALRMQSLATLFDISLETVLDHGRARIAQPLALTLADGRHFSGFARCHWPVWSAGAGAAADAHAAASRVASGSASARAGTDALAQAAGHARYGAPGIPGARGGRTAHADVSDAVSTVAGSAGASPTAPSRPQAQKPGLALAQLRTGDATFAAVLDKVARVIDHDIPLLVLGEPGSGKEMLARAMHADSARAASPFVTVNCAALPPEQIEAELFGAADHGGMAAGEAPRGKAGRRGKVAQAQGGTLFLDEVGHLPLSAQARLLRVMQERQVPPNRPAEGAPAAVLDVAWVCASSQNLRELIERQAFREDLYYRLNGLAVRLPPLRERSDLLALARRMLESLAGPRRQQLAPQVQAIFERYAWPGNVRQMHQVLRTASAMAGAEPVITCAHLGDDLIEETRVATALAAQRPPVEGSGVAAPGAAAGVAPGLAPSTVSRTLDDMELDLIRRTVESVNGNISEASKRLGISRNTIYRKLRWRQAAATPQ